MSGVPPLPPGFVPEARPDPWTILKADGFVATNGYRTDEDVAQIKAQGYTPARKGAHNRGDGVDLTHPKLNSRQQTIRLRELAKRHGWKAKVLDEGHHRHMAIEGWGAAPGTPGTPNSGLPEIPPGFDLEQRGSLKGSNFATTGEVHDGDTVKLDTGRNGRLFGADAYELGQVGRRPDGSLVPLGLQARNYLTGQIDPDTEATGTGDTTYGRPVVTLGDAGENLLREGLGLAEPKYLAGSPQFAPFMEAERLARWNRLGGHGTNAETPAQFRRKDGPWQGAEPGKWGEGQAVFGDEATPFQGLRPEIEQGYLAIWNDPKSKPEDLIAFAKANGFEVSEEFTRKQYAKRFKDGDTPDSEITYGAPPRLLTNVGDGATGAAVRGFGDPINMLDELGGLVNTVVPGARDFDGARENIWNSDRRFGDILWSNIDQNRGILQYDDEKHPIARFAGQAGSSVLLPFGAGARTPMAIAKAGALEGALAGFGSGEGDVIDRLPNAVAGTVIGGATGYGLGKVGEKVVEHFDGANPLEALRHIFGGESLASRRIRQFEENRQPQPPGDFRIKRGEALRDGVFEAAPIINGGVQNAGPTPAARSQPQGGVVSRIADDDNAWSGASKGQQIDFNVVGDLPSAGLAPANKGSDGRLYVAPSGATHFQAAELFPENVTAADMGFVTPDGAYLSREEALNWLDARGVEVNPSENMAGQLDAIDYREQAGPRIAEMRVEDDGAELVGPVAELERQPDRIDVSQLPPLPDGFVLDEPSLGRTGRMDERPSAEALAEAARRVSPDDVISTGPNRVETLEEASRANPSRFEEMEAPNPLDELGVRRIPSRKDLYRSTKIRGPFDVSKQIRRWGGVKDQGGELSHLGITNAPRKLEFGSNEQFLGKLIDNEKGLTLDEVGERLFDDGWLPERPTTAEVVDILGREHRGDSVWHPESLNEVEAFRASQAEADRINKARDEGSPLVEERGEAISLDDLRKMDVPLAAYEDRGTGRVANLNVSKLETKADIQRALQATEAKFGGFDAARRGKVSNAETEALASELNMTADDLLRRRPGQALNAHQALAARQILAKSGDELVAMARKVREGGNGDVDLADFHKAMLRHAAIQEQVTGAVAEAGRTLQSLKMVARARDHRGRVLKAIIEGAGGKHSLEDAADAIIDLQRVPGALNKFARDVTKPTWKDKAVELWYNSLLSGPQTHAVNILSNSLTAALQLPEHLAAGAIGKARSAMFRKGAVDRVLLSEIGPRTVGLIQGASEGLKAFRHTLRTGDVSDFVTKVESARQEAIGGIKGKVIRVPTRLLSAEDELFKAAARRMQIAGLATRKATGEGLKGDKLKARIEELTANPTPEMVDKSMDYARYLTFQRPLGPAMQNIMAVTQRHPWLKLFVPFIRTPTNILKHALERSPAAPLLKEVRDDIKAGGAQRDIAVARMALGTGLGMLVTQWAEQGLITGGGPADENAKRVMRADGWEPYSLKIGDTYYSFRRLDPLASTLGVAADLVNLQEHMTDKQREKLPALLIASVLQNLENKTWLSGLSDLQNLFEDPMRYSQSFVERLAGSIAVPAISAQTARTLDPVQRETSSEGYAAGILDAIRARIPGASKGLLPKRDVWGDEVRNEGGVGPDLASPIFTGTAENDPVAREVLAVGATIGPVSRDVGGARLPDDLYDQYAAIAGQLTRQYIEADMNAPEWGGLSADEKRNRIDKAKKAARKDARDALSASSS